MLGRFTQVDPLPGYLTAPVSRHAYVYGFNNPLRYSDPSGLQGGPQPSPTLPPVLPMPIGLEGMPQWVKDRINIYVGRYNSATDDTAKLAELENVDAIIRLATGGYSPARIKAVLYAIDHAYDTCAGGKYGYIREHDCANYVSICLNQHFPMDDTWWFKGVSDRESWDPRVWFPPLIGKSPRPQNIDAGAEWTTPGGLREYFSSGGRGTMPVKLKSLDDLTNIVKSGQVFPGDIGILGDDGHAIIITDVDIANGKAFYSGHTNERLNRDLMFVFNPENPTDDPIDFMYIVHVNYEGFYPLIK